MLIFIGACWADEIQQTPCLYISVDPQIALLVNFCHGLSPEVSIIGRTFIQNNNVLLKDEQGIHSRHMSPGVPLNADAAP